MTTGSAWPFTLQPAPPGARPWVAPAFIVALAALLHAAFITHPASVVFDEVFFGRYAMDYLRGQDFFDVHPPLAKLLFGAMAALLGLDPAFDYPANGAPYPELRYVWLRLPAHIAGVLLPLVFWGLARELGLSRRAAFAVGVLAALDNGWLVITRIVLTDGWLVLLGFGALWAYFRHRRIGRARTYVLALLLAGMAVSVKWTGLSFLGLIGALEAGRLWQERSGGLRRLWRPALLVTLPVAVYVAAFAVHFARTPPGPGTDPLHQAHARQAFVPRLLAENRTMWDVSRHMTAPHRYASRWYDWPFMMRPVDFWAVYDGPRVQRIYLLGNPVVWWATGYAMLFLLVNAVPKLPDLLSRRRPAPAGPAELFIVGGYLANLLPFTVIARVMFIYHYLPALGFALLGLGLLLDRCGRHARWLTPALLGLAALAFVYFAPLSYGFEISRDQFEARMWMPSWR